MVILKLHMSSADSQEIMKISKFHATL